MDNGSGAAIIPCSLAAGLLFVPKIVMLDGKNGLAAVLLGLIFALSAALLPGITPTGSKTVYAAIFFESVFAGGMILRVFSGLIKRVLLPEYGFMLPAVLMSAAVLYGCSKGRAAEKRFAVLAAPVLLVGTLLCLIPAAKDMDIKNISFFPDDPSKMLTDALYAGLLLALVPYTVNAGRPLERAALLALPGILVFAAAVIWLSRFDRVTDLPVLDLMYAGGGATAFVRRQEGLILGIITLSVYFMLGAATDRAAEAICSGRIKNGGCAVCTALILVCALLPGSSETAEIWFKYAVLAGGAFFLTVSVFKAVYGGKVKK